MHLPAKYSREDVQRLFYPDLEPDAVPQPLSSRQQDFLRAVSDDAYYSFYELLSLEPGYCFLDFQALLKTTKLEGKLMSTVVSHVGQWMNREPTKVTDRESNKPLLRKDLVAGLRAKYGEEAEDKSIALQQQLLDYLQDHSKDFTSTAMEHYLVEYPDTHGNKYAARFEYAGWRTLLSLVLYFAGPNLQHSCMVRFNFEDVHKQTSLPPPSSTVAQIARDLICQMPEIAQNPALQSARAADRLCGKMEAVFAQWILEECGEVSEQSSAVDVVEAERVDPEALLETPRSLLSLPSDKQATQHSVTYSRGDEDESYQDTPALESNKDQSCIKIKQTRVPASAVLVPPSATPPELPDLRAAHRARRKHRQQENKVASASQSVDQPKVDKQCQGDECRVGAVRGSKHWRQKAVAYSSVE